MLIVLCVDELCSFKREAVTLARKMESSQGSQSNIRQRESHLREEIESVEKDISRILREREGAADPAALEICKKDCQAKLELRRRELNSDAQQVT